MCFRYGRNFDWYCKLANLLCNSNKLAGFFMFAMAEALSLSMERIVVVVSNEYPKILSFVVKNYDFSMLNLIQALRAAKRHAFRQTFNWS